MWQSFTATNYQDIATKLEQLATSRCFLPGSLSITNGGTGYTQGDIVTISHASGLFPCTFEVNVVGGVVNSIARIINNGAFANRVASVTINASGSGYAVNDIVGILTGTATSPAKVKVTSIGGGGSVTGVSVFEGGGAYSANPTLTACPTTNVIGNGTGTGLTLNITMQGILIAIGVAPTGGTGSGLTVGGTLTDAGWTVLKSVNNYHLNSVLTEKEVVLQGSALTGQEAPIIGYRTGTNGSGGTLRNFLSFTGMTDFNPATSYDLQPNAINPTPGTGAGQYIQMLPAASSIQCWISGSTRRLSGMVRADGGSTTVYHPFYVGCANPFGTATEQPFPMLVMASCSSVAIQADSSNQIDISGLTECYKNSGRSGPYYMWNQATNGWVEIFNASAASDTKPYTINTDRVIWPVGKPLNQSVDTKADYIVEDGGWPSWNSICRATGEAPTIQLRPSPSSLGNAQALQPVSIISAADGAYFGTLDNVYWVSGIKLDGSSINPEDTFTFTFGPTKSVFRAFPNASRLLGYSFFAMQEGF